MFSLVKGVGVWIFSKPERFQLCPMSGRKSKEGTTVVDTGWSERNRHVLIYLLYMATQRQMFLEKKKKSPHI